LGLSRRGKGGDRSARCLGDGRLVLEPAIAEAVAVDAETPRIDATSTTGGTNYPAAVVAKLPVDRNYADIVRSNPGVGTDRGDTLGRSLALTIYGATSAENQWVIDGIDNERHQGQSRASHQQRVRPGGRGQTGGYQAEDGGASRRQRRHEVRRQRISRRRLLYYDSSGTTAQQIFVEAWIRFRR
jgi:hypothetical protein